MTHELMGVALAVDHDAPQESVGAQDDGILYQHADFIASDIGTAMTTRARPPLKLLHATCHWHRADTLLIVGQVELERAFAVEHSAARVIDVLALMSKHASSVLPTHAAASVPSQRQQSCRVRRINEHVFAFRVELHVGVAAFLPKHVHLYARVDKERRDNDGCDVSNYHYDDYHYDANDATRLYLVGGGPLTVSHSSPPSTPVHIFSETDHRVRLCVSQQRTTGAGDDCIDDIDDTASFASIDNMSITSINAAVDASVRPWFPAVAMDIIADSAINSDTILLTLRSPDECALVDAVHALVSRCFKVEHGYTVTMVNDGGDSGMATTCDDDMVVEMDTSIMDASASTVDTGASIMLYERHRRAKRALEEHYYGR